MTRYTTRALASLAMLGASLPTLAVPARPGAFTRTQPDGSVVTLRLHGDEKFSYMTDSNGYIVAEQPDGWYRILDNEGKATGLASSDFNMLSDADRTELSLINPQKSFDALRRNVAAAYSMRQCPAMKTASKVVSASKWDNSDGHDLRAVPTDGERHVLVILVNFSNLKWSFADDPQAEMTAMLNEPGYSGNHCTGSAADYFHASSKGIYQPKFDVYGPVELGRPYSFYGRNVGAKKDASAYQMVVDACELLDPDVDFSIYDTNGDGYVDNVYIFYAGYGENEGVGDNYVWPHSYDIHWETQCPEHDGVKIDHYACSNELTMQTIGDDKVTHSGIGTFCHEFSHVLGLPDLYATNYTVGAVTPGNFSIMDHGSYNNNARTPPLYSIYEKYALEWEKPIDITEDAFINMQPTIDNGYAYRITINPATPKEYYLFENRQQHGWDAHIPGHGMLVWHIDYDEAIWQLNVVNDTPNHQHIDLVEADGAIDESSRSGDPFPGSSSRSEFTSISPLPKFVNWNGKPSSLPITSIGEDENGIISFTAGTGGTPDSPLYIEQPQPVLTAIDNKSMKLEWQPVSGADKYYVTVTEMYVDDLFGTLEKNTLADYTFSNIGNNTTVEIKGLEPAHTYSVAVNASSANNLSTSGNGVFTTFDSDFSNVRPVLNVTPGVSDANLQWLGVAEATAYEATVATRVNGEGVPAVTMAWDNKNYPADWSFPGGSFDTRDDYVGQSSPSLRMVNGTALTTGIYDHDIKSFKMWARSSADASVSLKFYAVEPNFSLTPITEVTSLACSKEGTEVEISNMPDDLRQLLVLYTCKTAGTTVNIDDLVIEFAGDVTDTPVTGYDACHVDGTSLKAESLTPMTDYVAYIRALKGDDKSAMSRTVYFSTADPSGVETVDASFMNFTMANGVVSSQAPMDIFTLTGMPIALQATGSVRLPEKGIYLIRVEGKTSKVVW